MLIVPLEENAQGGLPHRIGAAARGQAGGQVDIERHLRPVAAAQLHVRIDIVGDIFADPQLRVALAVGGHVEVIQIKAAAQL